MIKLVAKKKGKMIEGKGETYVKAFETFVEAAMTYAEDHFSDDDLIGMQIAIVNDSVTDFLAIVNDSVIEFLGKRGWSIRYLNA